MEVVDKREGVRDETGGLKKTEEYIRVSYTNVDGFLSKRLECIDHLKSDKPDIMCIVESKLRPNIQIDWFGDGYRIWRKDRANRDGGGIMVLTRKELCVQNVNIGDGDEEVVGVVVSNGGHDINIVTVYVPPKTSAWSSDQYNSMVKSTMERMRREAMKKEKIVLVGDFNCKGVKWEEFEVGSGGEWGEQLLNYALENLMTQWVKQTTRGRQGDTPSRLDLIFTKGVNLENEVEHECPLGKSDHELLKFAVKVSFSKDKEVRHKEKSLNYAKGRYDDLRNYFENVDWSIVYQETNMQVKYEKFMEIYNEAAENFVPKYTQKNLKGVQWFNKDCEKSKREKERAWKEYKRSNGELEGEIYRNARNEYVQVRRRAQKEYEQRIVEKCESDPKMFYKFINGKLQRKESIEKVKVGGEIYEDTKVIVEKLNENFCKVFTEEGQFNQSTLSETKTMQGITIVKSDIEEVINKLDENKAMGPDGVSGRMLKECKKQLLDPILNLIRTSITTGQVPVEWKRADVVPIYKSGCRMETLNYRPVSLTSIMCKICEEVIKSKWSEFLENERILNEKQFGFRKGRSCVSNLLCFYSRVIDVLQERNGWVDCVYLDLKKAFDKVPHNRLMWKLRNIGGISGSLEEWMKNYLTDREMRTVVKGTKSDWRKVTSGVPQGSVLGPIMFLIYVNDMPEGVKSYMNMFADDAKIMKRIRNMDDCNALQRDLDKINEWSRTWQMEFNTNKSCVMRMGRSKYRPHKNYQLGRSTLVEVGEEKDLGVIVQNNLSPEKHINGIFGKTYSMLQSIGLAFNYLDENMMRKILTTLIRPQLEYASVIWSPYMKKHVKKLERVQRLATRMIPQFKELPYEERLSRMELSTLEERRVRGDMITMFKITHGVDILDREDLITMASSNYLRGHQMKIVKDTCTSDIKKYSFPYRSIEKWNKLSVEVVCAASVSQMKEKLDKCGQRDRT